MKLSGMMLKNVIFLTTLLRTALSVLTVDAQSKDVITAQDIDFYLKKGDEAINLLGNGDEFIVLVGKTGAGKSTLSKFMRKHPTLRVAKVNKEDDNSPLMFVDGDETIGSKDVNMSKTFYPNIDKYKEEGWENEISIIDCAGFSDTRIPGFDLISFYLNKKILDSSKKLKIVIVEDFSSLQLGNERSGFTRTLEYVSQLIGSNLHALNGSIGMIATKADSTSPDESLSEIIKEFLNATKEHLMNEQAKTDLERDEKLHKAYGMQAFIVTSLLGGDGKLALFRKPTQLGSPWEAPLAENYAQIHKLVFTDLKFATDFDKEFKVAVAPITVNFINEGVLPLTDNITSQHFRDLQSIILADILRERQYDALTAITYFDDQYSTVEKLNSFSQILAYCQRRGIAEYLLEDLGFQVYKFQFLYEVTGKSFDDIQKKISDFFGFKHHIAQHIKSMKNFLSFQNLIVHDLDTRYAVQVKFKDIAKKVETEKIGTIVNSLHLHTLGFSNKVTTAAESFNSSAITSENERDLKKIIKEKTYNPVETVDDGKGNVIFSARILILSKIRDKIRRKTNGTKEIILIAFQKLYVDCDLELQRIHLTLFAPLVEIVESQRDFKLIGKHGQSFPGTASHSTSRFKNGENGRSGTPGRSSGSFRIFALDIFYPHLLSISSDGGNGGKGENGGNGVDAIEQDTYPTIPKRRAGEVDLKLDNYGTLNKTIDTLGYRRSGCEVPYRNAISYFSERYECYITIKDSRRYVPPTSGGNGGNAGAGALAGEQNFFVKSESAKFIKSITKDGSNGVPGKGGKAGLDGDNCKYTTYFCKTHKQYVTLNHEIECDFSSSGICSSEKSHFVNGIEGGIVSDSKNDQVLDLQRILLPLYKRMAQQNYVVKDDDLLLNFIHYILNSKEFIHFLNTDHYLKFLDVLNGFVADNMYQQSNLINIHSIVYNSFKQFQKDFTGASNAQLSVIDLMFISRLDSLNSFFQGNQIVQLTKVVEKSLDDLESVTKNIIKVSNFRTVSEKKNLLQKEIIEARRLIDQIHGTKMNQLERQLDDNFESLLKQSESLRSEYEENELKLKEQQEKLSRALEVKTVFGIFDTIVSIGGMFSPVSASLGNTVLSIGKSAAGINRRKRSHDDIEVANQVLVDYEETRKNDTFFRWNFCVDAYKKLAVAEAKVGNIISPENLESVNQIFSTKRPVDKTVDILDTIPSVFDSLNANVDKKIAKFELEGNSQDKIKELKNIKKGLRMASYTSTAAGAVMKLIQEKSEDARKLEEIEEAIEQNAATLNELAVFERNLHSQFKPMVSGMLSAVDQFKSKIADQSTFLLLFQKVEIKKNARKFISAINKFTKSFASENEEFRSIAFEMEDFMTTMISAFDKIHELQNRVQLTDFLGQIHSGQCTRSLTTDPEICNMYLNVSSTIRTNAIISESMQIFTAYQQVLFPYGGEKMRALNSTLQMLNQNSNNLSTIDKVQILREAFQIIRKDLSDKNNKINAESDKHITIAQFDSKHVSSRSFFVWPGSKYSKAIKDLFNGETVTLVASILEEGIRNAVKFKSAMLKVSSTDAQVEEKMLKLLDNFVLEMTHSGESRYRCGTSKYVIGGQSITFKASFERDRNGDFISKNNVYEKLNYGEVPLSPYTLWKFRLVHSSSNDLNKLRKELSLLADQVDLELVGFGYFLDEGAPICKTDLGKFYNYF